MFPCKKRRMKKMKQWKHLILEQRKVISSGIAHEYKLKDIAESLQFDPTSISKEVKRNRIKTSIGLKNDCKKTKRWPYVCTGCKNRYSNCPFTKYKYDATTAQRNADTNLVNSRRGIDIDDEKLFNCSSNVFIFSFSSLFVFNNDNKQF